MPMEDEELGDTRYYLNKQFKRSHLNSLYQSNARMGQAGYEAGENVGTLLYYVLCVFPLAITVYFGMRVVTACLGVIGLENDFFQYSHVMKGVILTPAIIWAVYMRIVFPRISIIFVILGSLSFIGTYFS